MGNNIHLAGVKKEDHGGSRNQQPQAVSAVLDQFQAGVKGDDHGGSRNQQPQVVSVVVDQFQAGAAERAPNQLQPLGGDFEATSMMDHTLLKDVTQESHCWRVRVRITRMSRFMREQEPETVLRLDFVMLDEQGGMMEGQVPTRHVPLFEPLIKEDTIYYVHYFQVDDARPTYRATDHPFMAKFTGHTKLTEVGLVLDNFPMYACRLASFDVLRTRENNVVFMSDTVGVMTGVSHVTTVPVKGAPRSIRNVYISNGRETATVALWGPHASQFPAEALHQQAQSGPVVILFLGLTIRIREGQLYLQGSNVCRWYMNAAIPEVIALQNSFAGVPCNVRWFGRSPAQSQPVHAAVEDIWDLNPHETLGNAYDVDIVVRSLVPDESWWYVGCKGCKRKMVRSSSGYKCFKCGGTVKEIRYRLALLGFDPTHMYKKEPKVAEFVFFGNIGEQLTGAPAQELVAAGKGSAGYIPPEITALYGRRYNLKVSVSRGSLQRARISYKVDSMSTLPPPPPLGDKGKSTAAFNLSIEAHGSGGSQTPESVHVHAIQANTRTTAEQRSPSMVTELTVEENKGISCSKIYYDKQGNVYSSHGSAALHTPPTTEIAQVAKAGAKRRPLDDESTDHDASTDKCSKKRDLHSYFRSSAKRNLQKPAVIRKLFTEETDTN